MMTLNRVIARFSKKKKKKTAFGQFWPSCYRETSGKPINGYTESYILRFFLSTPRSCSYRRTSTEMRKYIILT